MTENLVLFGKGVAMGAADAVPGVSGGTIAFITGIYEELLESIRRIDWQALRAWRQGGLRALWQHINGPFLLVLLSGIGVSLLTLAHVVTYLLAHHPELLSAFFFGLIMASVLLVGRQIERWEVKTGAAMLVGALLAYSITHWIPGVSQITALTLFMAGAVAICAMILPGISGSFILLLMGMYGPVMNAIKGLQLDILSIFAAGCVVGLLGFVRVLSWMLRHYRNVTLALLSGFLVGSLNKVWPWKQTLSYRLDSHGETVPLVQQNLWPEQYFVLTGDDPQLIWAVLLAVIGFGIVWGVERLGSASQR